jgi:hypothetical protein
MLNFSPFLLNQIFGNQPAVAVGNPLFSAEEGERLRDPG